MELINHKPTLKAIASGSDGNAYLIDVGGEKLLIECGVRWNDIMDAADFRTIDIVGCLVSHSHDDHMMSIKHVLRHHIDVYGTREEILNGTETEEHYRMKFIEPNKPFMVGNFKVMAISTQHDSPNPVGYLIKHPVMGTMLFATDTFYLRQKFSFPIHHILLECNYDTNILKANLERGIIDSKRYDRTFTTHMSLDNCIGTLKAMNLTELKNLMLIHLSSENSNEHLCRERITRECNIDFDRICCATKNTIINL